MYRKNCNNKEYYGLFNDSFPPIIDGVALAVENYAKHLNNKGFETCVVTPWNPVSPELPYEIIRYFSLPIHSRKPYRYGYPKLDPFIWRTLRNTPFRIVHSHCPFSSGRLGVYVKKKQGVPLIGTFHSKYESDLKHSFKYTPWMVPIIMGRILDFFNACDEVWIPQAQVEETVREYGYKGKLEVVENGSDFSTPPEKELREIKIKAKQSKSIGPTQLSLLFVGQHIWEKGLGIICDALPILKNHGVDFRMNFVGSGYAQEELKNKIQDMGLSDSVIINRIVSDRNQLAEFYAAGDLFLFPSLYDNAPLVLREAAAFATPGILPIGSTAAEVITDDFNGFLSAHSGSAYAEKILKLSENREKILDVGLNASGSIVRSWEDVVEEVIDRYTMLIKRKS